MSVPIPVSPAPLSPAQLAAMEAAARSWEGTPFCEGSPVKGAGVSCHHCVAEIDFESGLLPRVPVPNGPPGWGIGQERSLIVEWIEASGLFVELPLSARGEPGAHLGFRVGHNVHHLALALGGGRIVHCIRTHGVVIAPCVPDAWLRRLARVWRVR